MYLGEIAQPGKKSMILFLGEERAYLNWVTHHRTGFVLDCLRHPAKGPVVLHRTTCSLIKQSTSQRTHWTLGKHLKGCSLDLDELKTWVREQTEREATYCSQCSPEREVEIEPHLTRLDRDILDYVIDIALSHIDEADHAYSLTVGMVARCLGKSEAQLGAALQRLTAEGLLVLTGKVKPGAIVSARSRVFPTVKALRMQPAYSAMSDEEIEAELQNLIDD